MSRATFGFLLLVAGLFFVAFLGVGPAQVHAISVQAWPSLCETEFEKQNCSQSCRDSFDPIKDYAGYTNCVESCKQRCKSAKEPWPPPP